MKSGRARNAAKWRRFVHKDLVSVSGNWRRTWDSSVIVGDFRTDEGPIEPDAVQRDDGSWLIAGSMPVDEMAERLFIKRLR
jgi:hypothetical protein